MFGETCYLHLYPEDGDRRPQLESPTLEISSLAKILSLCNTKYHMEQETKDDH
jgi:hypothetical protein